MTQVGSFILGTQWKWSCIYVYWKKRAAKELGGHRSSTHEFTSKAKPKYPQIHCSIHWLKGRFQSLAIIGLKQCCPFSWTGVTQQKGYLNLSNWQWCYQCPWGHWATQNLATWRHFPLLLCQSVNGKKHWKKHRSDVFTWHQVTKQVTSPIRKHIDFCTLQIYPAGYPTPSGLSSGKVAKKAFSAAAPTLWNILPKV